MVSGGFLPGPVRAAGREIGARLLQLLDRVTADGLFPELGREKLTYTRRCVHVARLLGVTTGTLMDLTEGHLELPFS
ncbi:hypothetical protein ECZC10_46200 [Escherichia coli]|nr:hypothetical protein ECZC10_46200 [Escherichia coli]